MTYVKCVAFASILGVAGMALGQPTLDGKLDPQYGPMQWKQSTPTQFGDAAPIGVCVPVGFGIQVGLNNTNRAGIPSAFPVTVLSPAQVAAASAVTTGLELVIPLSELGSPSTIRIAGFVTNDNYGGLSSQIIGGINGNTTLGGYPGVATADFSLAAGNQFITVPATVPVGTPTIDGQLDAAFYGAPIFVQDTVTNYGDASVPVVPADSIYKAAGGSEIDAVYARVSGGNLHVFVAGNLESNFNKLSLFFDTGATPQAQNVLLNTNNNTTGVINGGPNAMAGLKFDAGFSASYWLSATVGGGPEIMFVDFARLGTAAQNGAMRSINIAGTTTNPLVAASCPVVAPDPNTAGGSEIDGLYATVCGQFLYLFIPGNLETNGNWLDLFFDVGNTTNPVSSAGQSRIRRDNVTVGTGALQRMAEDPADPFISPGLEFSTGFQADYFLAFKNSGLPVDVFAIAATMNASGAQNDGLPVIDPANPTDPARPSLYDYGSFVGGLKSANNPLSFDGQLCVRTAPVTGNCTANGIGSFWNPTSIPGLDIQGDASGSANNPLQVLTLRDIFSSFAPRLISANAFDPLNRGTPSSPTPSPSSLAVPGLIRIAIDNSNRGGVTGSDASFAAAVTTGIEVRVRLDEIGYSGSGPIRVTGWINGFDHGFLSNQVIGGALLTSQPNLGNPRFISFNNVQGTGPFYVTIAPGSCLTAATGACCFGANNEVCSIMSQAQCVATIAGGNYRGDASACTPGICTGQASSGRCCVGSRCVIVADLAACTALRAASAGSSFTPAVSNCNVLGNRVAPCCQADYNKSTTISVQDIFDFLNGWFASNINADINNSGNISVQDIFDFLSAWFAGGC